MRQFSAISVSLILLSSLFLGCTRTAQKNDGNDGKGVPIDPVVKVSPPVEVKEPNKNPPAPAKPAGLDAAKQAKYDAAFTSALTALADHKWRDALAAYEIAKSIKDDDFVRSEIAMLKQRIAQDGTAKDIVKNIETVLDDGNAADAAKLAKDALKEFGDGDAAAKLVQLQLQAEAIKNAEKDEDKDARFARFKKEGETAQAEKNLRAAAQAFELALLAKDDADLQKTCADLHGTLDTYDALRKKAAELRKDPTQIDDAIAALTAAKAAWDTPQIKQDLDEAMAAKLRKRETVSVADFEVRNDVGMADAGNAIADELLPLLKPRFDLAGRDQLKQAVADLRIAPTLADDAKQQAQLGRVLNARYLVVGTVHRFVGVSIRARLVDVQTGLVVQTGKLMTDTMDEAIKRMPELAQQLLVIDDAKMQEDEAAPKVAAVPVIPVNAVVPPAPAKDAPQAKPVLNGVAPGFGNAKADVFAKLATPADPSTAAPPAAPLDAVLRGRLQVAAVQMGDYLFSVGRFADAQQQYAFALSLDPTNWDVRQRLTMVQPLVPPPAPYAMMFGQPILPRPRLTVLPFMTIGDPSAVSPALSTWMPTNLGPYFSSRYDVADPNLFYWYMSSLGLSMNDVLNNPNTLRWLGRATGVRYFVAGNLIQTAPGFSVNANTYLIDSELGYPQSSASINVQSPMELRLRLPELAMLTMMSPLDQAIYQGQQQLQYNNWMAQGLTAMGMGQYIQAINAFNQALAIRPGDVQAQYYLAQAQQLAQTAAWQYQRQQQWLAQQALNNAMQQRQMQLAQATSLAGKQAVASAAALTPAQRQTRSNYRFGAQTALIGQAEAALKSNRFGVSVNLIQAANGLSQPTSSPVNVPQSLIDQARTGAQQAEQQRIAQFIAARQQKRDQQLQQVVQQITTDYKSGQSAQSTASAAQTARDEKAFEAAKAQGLNLMAKNNYIAALAAFQGAQRLKQTDQVAKLIDTATERQALAQAKSDQERQAIEQRFLAERQQAKTIAVQTKPNEIPPVGKKTAYQTALSAGQKALKAKDYNGAIASFQQALQAMPNDAQATQLLQQAQQAHDHDAKTQAGFKSAMDAGQTAMNAKKYATAVKAFNDAVKLHPSDATAKQSLQQAQQALTDANNQGQATAAYQKAMNAGRAAMSFKRYDIAVKAYNDALKWMPNDPAATAALQQAQQAHDNPKVKTPPAPPPVIGDGPAKDYPGAMQRAAAFEKDQKYADAAKAYQEALKFRKQDKEAMAGWSKNQYSAHMAQGQQYLDNMMYIQAQQQAQFALTIYPNDPDAKKLLQKAKNKGK